MKKFLATCTYGQLLELVSQVSRDQDISALDELKRFREKGMQVGEGYATAFLNSKVTALRMSYVEAVPNSATLYEVKENEQSSQSCIVNIASAITWMGMDFKIVTGTCSLSKSTHITCPSACACAC